MTTNGMVKRFGPPALLLAAGLVAGLACSSSSTPSGTSSVGLGSGGDGGGTAGDAARGDSGKARSDSGEKSDGSAAGLSASYAATWTIQITPSKLGSSGGLTACKMKLGGTITKDTGASACKSCAGTWSGSVTSTASDCSKETPTTTMDFGLASDPSGGIQVWQANNSGVWTESGVASGSGSSYVATFSSALEAGKINLGTQAETLTLTPK
jgi:hypothetical protein